MIYKIIVNDNKDYDKLKPYAYYCSERTKVMCFDMDVTHEAFHIVAKYFKEENADNDSVYPVTYNNGIYIRCEDHEMAVFFNSWVKSGYVKVGVADWWKVYLLLKHKILAPDQSFMSRFPACKKTDNINAMKSWSMKTKFRRPDWTFKECAKKALGFDGEKGIQIASCKFLTDSVIERDYSVVTGYVMDKSADGKQILFKDDSGEVYQLQIKGWPFHFNSNAWVKNKKLSFYHSSKGTEVYNPVIIPSALNLQKPEAVNELFNEFGYLSNRCCPTELLNRLKAEVYIRLLFDKEVK